MTAHNVNFLRTTGSLPLPIPQRGGDVNQLRKILDITDDKTWLLLLGWLTAAFKERGDHPTLVVSGQADTGKTTLSSALINCIDPREPAVVAMPTKDDDLLLTAHSRWVSAFDELDHLTNAKARVVAGIATGTGRVARALWKDTEVNNAAVRRPLILNGMGELLEEARAWTRAVPVPLEGRVYCKRQAKGEIERALDDAQPQILGALLTLIEKALADHSLPPSDCDLRMVDAFDFADRCVAAAGYARGTFLRAVTVAQKTAARTASNNWVVLPALCEVAAKGFDGLATELLSALARQPSAQKANSGWPKDAATLGRQLSQFADQIRGLGIVLERKKTNAGAKLRLYMQAAEPVKQATPGPLSLDHLESLRRQYEIIEKAEPTRSVAYGHDDNTYTLFGPAVTELASKLGRPAVDGPSLRLTLEEAIDAYESRLCILAKL